MSTARFWCLRDNDSQSKLAEWVDDDIELEVVKCPVNDGHRRGGKRLTNLSVALPGRSTEDVVWTWYSECLLTDRVLELFKASGFTGFEVKPVKAVFKRSKEKPPRLWELVVTGWAGIAPPESGVKVIEHCSDCGYTTYSAWTHPEKLIDSAQWDGSDFFMVWPLAGEAFVTDRVAGIIRANELSGVVLKNSCDLVFPSSVIPRIGGGRLSYYMPEARARELGEPLGIY